MSKWMGMFADRHRIRHLWEAYTDGTYKFGSEDVELKSYGFLLEKLP